MKLISGALMCAMTLGLAGTAMAAETYIKAEDATATAPWELTGDALKVKSGTRINDNPTAGVGTIRFRVPAGEVSSNQQQYFSLRYKSTNNGNNSVYSTSANGAFVKHNLPTGSDFQWFDTNVNIRSANNGSVEYVVTYREANAEVAGLFVSDDPNAKPNTNRPTPPVVSTGETYLKANISAAMDPWEVSGDALKVRLRIKKNENPTEGVGAIRFSIPAGQLFVNQPQYFWLRYKSTSNGNNSVYSTAANGSFVSHNLPTGNDFQWFDTGVSINSTNNGSAEYVVTYREAGAEVAGIFVSHDPNAVPNTDEGSVEPTPQPTIQPTAQPTPTPVVVVPGGDVAGVRDYPAIGIKKWPRAGVFREPPKGWLSGVWNEHMADAIKAAPCAFSEHYPAMSARIKWKHAYIDSNIKPTRSQARDPNWSNYVWNKKGTPPNGVVWDGITDALNSPEIDNGNGPGKLLIIMSLTMTTSQDSPPLWMRKDSNLTWNALSGANSATGLEWHVRFDNPTAVDHAADFMEAVLAKYGNNKGIQAIQLGEYYFGPTETRPSGFSKGRYYKGMRDLWNRMSAAAPIDSNGTRVHLAQVSPLFDDEVTLDDLESAGLGMTQSDLYMNLPVAGSPSEKMLDGYNRGMHTAYDADARYSCIGRAQRWDGTANPFGHKEGYRAVVTPQEYFWYHSENGPVPGHSLFMTIAPNSVRCAGSIQTKANWIDAIKTFGRCGSQANTWGGSPASR